MTTRKKSKVSPTKASPKAPPESSEAESARRVQDALNKAAEEVDSQIEERFRSRYEVRDVKGWQVQLYYDIMVDIGMADFIQEIMEEKSRTNMRRASTAAEQMGSPTQEGEDAVAAVMEKLDMQRVIVACSENRRIIDLFRCVLGIRDPVEAEEASLSDLEAEFYFFAVRSARILDRQLAFVRHVV